MTLLRVLSYNIRSVRDDPDAVVRVIRSAGPDVVCVQEAPKWFRWRSRCAALARNCDLMVATGGLAAGHNLLMCRVAVDVDDTRDVQLSRAFGMHQRGVAMATCTLGGSRFRLVGSHLSLDPDERRRHVREIFSLIGEPAEPVVIGADVNEEAGRMAWTALAARFPECGVAGGTFPASTGRRRIDGIFASRSVGVRSAVVLDSADVRAASDHRPILAELELAAGTPEVRH